MRKKGQYKLNPYTMTSVRWFNGNGKRKKRMKFKRSYYLWLR